MSDERDLSTLHRGGEGQNVYRMIFPTLVTKVLAPRCIVALYICIFSTFYAFYRSLLPCIRLERGKFELTNQDSAGGKNSSVLKSSKQVRKGFGIRQLFSLEMALNIHERGFTFSNTIPVCKK